MAQTTKKIASRPTTSINASTAQNNRPQPRTKNKSNKKHAQGQKQTKETPKNKTRKVKLSTKIKIKIKRLTNTITYANSPRKIRKAARILNKADLLSEKNQRMLKQSNSPIETAKALAFAEKYNIKLNKDILRSHPYFYNDDIIDKRLSKEIMDIIKTIYSLKDFTRPNTNDTSHADTYQESLPPISYLYPFTRWLTIKQAADLLNRVQNDNLLSPEVLRYIYTSKPKAQYRILTNLTRIDKSSRLTFKLIEVFGNTKNSDQVEHTLNLLERQNQLKTDYIIGLVGNNDSAQIPETTQKHSPDFIKSTEQTLTEISTNGKQPESIELALCETINSLHPEW